MWQALQGHFPCYMIEAAKGLARAQEQDEVMEVVSNASSHGETSGTDAMVGLCWYLDEGKMIEHRTSNVQHRMLNRKR